MISNLKLYHCNDATRCNRFLADNSYYIKCEEDGKWLGSGMYFWDNISNALYWHDIKIRNNKNIEYLFISANIVINKLLDLTDELECKKMDFLWYAYQNTINKHEKIELGKRLNILFEYFSEIFEPNYDVIKIYGYYKIDDNCKFVEYDPSIKSPQPILNIKCIYSVRTISCIFDRKVEMIS